MKYFVDGKMSVVYFHRYKLLETFVLGETEPRQVE